MGVKAGNLGVDEAVLWAKENIMEDGAGLSRGGAQSSVRPLPPTPEAADVHGSAAPGDVVYSPLGNGP